MVFTVTPLARVRVAIHAPIAVQLGLTECYRMVNLEQEIGPGESLRALIHRLALAYPSITTLIDDPHVVVAVNMAAITTEQELEAALHDGDEIVLLSSYTGG